STMPGTGSALSFGLLTAGATYTVSAADNATGCAANMAGSATVVADPKPVSYNVTGGGSYCAGGTGVAIGVANSENGIDYQLYDGATAIGGPFAGTGLAFNFGNFTTA